MSVLCWLLALGSALGAEIRDAGSGTRENLGTKALTDHTISINFGTSIGRIKPLHGVNGGPFSQGAETDDLITYHAEAGFPYTRLHDCRWPSPNVVDIPCVFPLFHADAKDC